MKYSIDTSAIIDCWLLYPPDVFPALWDRLNELIDHGVLIGPEEALRELARKDDEAYRWARGHRSMFVPEDPRVQAEARQVLKRYPRLVDEEKETPDADPFVIALARVQGCSVVTREKLSRNPKERPKIPDVCRELGVQWLNILGMFRELGWKF